MVRRVGISLGRLRLLDRCLHLCFLLVLLMLGLSAQSGLRELGVSAGKRVLHLQRRLAGKVRIGVLCMLHSWADLLFGVQVGLPIYVSQVKRIIYAIQCNSNAKSKNHDFQNIVVAMMLAGYCGYRCESKSTG